MESNKYLLDREIYHQRKEILLLYSKCLEDVINFGTNLIKWAEDKVHVKDEDFVAILFLRNLLEQVDAISVLIKVSSVEPCKSLMRTIIENFFSLEYLLEKDTDNRANTFKFYYIVDNNKAYRRMDGKSQQYKQRASTNLKDKIHKKREAAFFEDAEKYIEVGEEMLNDLRFKEIKAEYDNFDSKKKPEFWFSLFDGPKNIADLSEYLRYPGIYNSFYRNWSYSVHGNDILFGKIIRDKSGKINVKPLRNNNNAQAIFRVCYFIVTESFDRFYSAYIVPNHYNEYRDWVNVDSKEMLKAIINASSQR